MSIYEIIAVVFSSISLLTSVPAFILSVRQNKKLNREQKFTSSRKRTGLSLRLREHQLSM